MRWSVVQIYLADEGVFGVVEVTALGLNDPPHLPRVFFLPLGHDVVVGLNFEQPFEDQGKALGGRFFERQNFEVVVVQPQMAPVTFEMGFAEVVVEKCVVLEPGEFDLVRGKIEGPLQDAEGFLLTEQTDG